MESGTFNVWFMSAGKNPDDRRQGDVFRPVEMPVAIFSATPNAVLSFGFERGALVYPAKPRVVTRRRSNVYLIPHPAG